MEVDFFSSRLCLIGRLSSPMGEVQVKALRTRGWSTRRKRPRGWALERSKISNNASSKVIKWYETSEKMASKLLEPFLRRRSLKEDAPPAEAVLALYDMIRSVNMLEMLRWTFPVPWMVPTWLEHPYVSSPDTMWHFISPVQLWLLSVGDQRFLFITVKLNHMV